MRLSELVAACNGTDPELAVEDENGIAQPVVGIETAVVLRNGRAEPVVLLEPARDDED